MASSPGAAMARRALAIALHYSALAAYRTRATALPLADFSSALLPALPAPAAFRAAWGGKASRFVYSALTPSLAADVGSGTKLCGARGGCRRGWRIRLFQQLPPSAPFCRILAAFPHVDLSPSMVYVCCKRALRRGWTLWTSSPGRDAVNEMPCTATRGGPVERLRMPSRAGLFACHRRLAATTADSLLSTPPRKPFSAASLAAAATAASPLAKLFTIRALPCDAAGRLLCAGAWRTRLATRSLADRRQRLRRGDCGGSNHCKGACGAPFAFSCRAT